MKDHWYCRVDGQQFGPFSWDQMRAMAAEGRLVSESHVRRQVDQRWFEAGKIPGLLGTPKSGGPAAAAPVASKAASPESTSGPATSSTVSTASREEGAAPAKSNGHATQKLRVAKPVPPADSQPATANEPKAPPRVAAKSAATPPLPLPAKTESPLGIVAAPPVAGAAKSGKKLGRKSPSEAALRASLAAAAKKDEHGLSPLLVGGVLGGIALVLLAVAGGVVAWQVSRETPPIATNNTAAPAAAETKPIMTDAELDAILASTLPPEPAETSAAPERAASSPAANSAETATATAAPAAMRAAVPDPNLEAQRKLIAAQPRWTPVEGMRIRMPSRDLQVEFAQVWLATDAKGTRVDPALPAAPGAGAPAAKSGVAQSATSAASPTPAKFVFIEMRVTNSGSIPRKYNSWNAGDATMAVLAGQDNEPLAGVPVAETPGVARQSALHIAAGQSISDVLVFQAPAQPFDSLKLLLSQAALAAGGRGYFPVEIPVEYLFKRAQSPAPAAVATAAPDGAAAPAEGEGKAAPPRDPNAPPSLEEFTKSLEDDKKMLDKQKAADNPAPKPEPKP